MYDAGSLPENHVSDEIVNSFNFLEDLISNKYIKKDRKKKERVWEKIVNH